MAVYHVVLETLYEPGHAKMCLMPYANNKGADQPAHSLSDPIDIISGTPPTFPVDSVGQPSESLTQSNVSYTHALFVFPLKTPI